MFKRDTLIILLIAVFLVTPALLALAMYVVTKNPSLRPLGITLERLVEAGLMEDRSLIVVQVDIGSKAPAVHTRDDYATAIETAFARLDAEARVRFRTVPEDRSVSVTYLVGESRIGPFPMSRAAEGVLAAVQAERLLVRQRRTTAEADERRTGDGFWHRLFD
ncbi:hypothetical protein [Celeribacter indicus]|uniref:Uncharacterized protein n=1 Tax=Celeribacter indicus TaxID=1208324 RepID=A0A0B5DUW1_9RHOB|nr:hypothetical protein [Celeribacter indicus]AJE45010.1 hypothetical protein P73_0295 [Celeribacter indicus]SDW94854.1 hypothetical protein SAMN05443573_11013 [Celeribacter indicus]